MALMFRGSLAVGAVEFCSAAPEINIGHGAHAGPALEEKQALDHYCSNHMATTFWMSYVHQGSVPVNNYSAYAYILYEHFMKY
jgi:hypothetical protein